MDDHDAIEATIIAPQPADDHIVSCFQLAYCNKVLPNFILDNVGFYSHRIIRRST